jgi:hypothetical protein
MAECTKGVDICERGQLKSSSKIFPAQSVTARKGTDCQRLINQLTSFIRIYRQSVITEEHLEFIPTYWTITTFSATDNFLKGCQLPFRIVC